MGIFEIIYFAGYQAKRAFDSIGRKRLPARVIGIGNLTTGGTGKTPAAMAVAREARARGMRPCILTRGYRGKRKGPVVVTQDMDWREAGDEPVLMASRMGDIPVIKGANRYKSGMFAVLNLPTRPDVFILDDGYQHFRLHRDVNVLLVSALNPFDNGRLLPMGHLREPLREMKRADVVVITKARHDTRDLEEVIRNHNKSAPVYTSQYEPVSVRTLWGEDHPLQWLRGREVFAFSGIAEPEGFHDTIMDAGANLRGNRAFGDHHQFTKQDIESVLKAARRAQAPWIITTEKDIMRLREFMLPRNVVVLGAEFAVEKAFYDLVFG